jgi:hypothetical protein
VTDDTYDLSRFKSRRPPGSVGVVKLVLGLPVHSISEAKDFVRLHPDEAVGWSDELCFVNIPTEGQSRDVLHLIDEELALTYLPDGDIERFRLALASKPHDVHFLCKVPTQNMDNTWNTSNLENCERAKTQWMKVSSRKKAENIDGYLGVPAIDDDAFPPPVWPKQPLNELIAVTFKGLMIMSDQDAALRRKIGKKLVP